MDAHVGPFASSDNCLFHLIYVVVKTVLPSGDPSCVIWLFIGRAHANRNMARYMATSTSKASRPDNVDIVFPLVFFCRDILQVA